MSLLVVFAALNVSLGLAHYSYIFVVFNSAQKILQTYTFPFLSTHEMSLIASSPFLGGVLGALVTERIGRTFGRRSLFMIADFISVVGTILSLTLNFSMFVIGRFMTGFTGGVATVLSNIYIAEIARDPLKGQLGTLTNAMFSIGPILAYLLGSFVPEYIEAGVPETGARILFSIPGIISLIKLAGFLFFFRFETPYYLVQKNNEEEAMRVLNMLYHDDNEEKLQEIISERDYMFESETIAFSDLFGPKYRKSFIVSLILCASIFTTGMSVPLTFSNMIFSEGAGDLDAELPLILTNIVGILNLFGSLAAVFLVKHGGRRPIAIYGYIVLTCINLAIVVIGFTYSISNVAVKVLVLIWIFVCALTTRPIAYVYPPETLPEVGVGLAVTAKWIFGFIAVQLFLPLKDSIWYTGIYLIFTFFALLATLVLYFFMIETKDRPRVEVLRLYGKQEQQEEKQTLIE